MFASYIFFPIPALYLLLAGAVFRRYRWGRLCGLFGLMILLITALPGTAKIMARPLLFPVPTASAVQAYDPDVILLPTAGVTRLKEGWLVPGEESMQRYIQASALQDQLQVPIILSGGDPNGNNVSEASVLARLEFPSQATVFLDETASNSAGNAAGFSRIMAEQQRRRPVLVTSALHMMRMSSSLANTGHVPLAYPVSDRFTQPISWQDFIPNRRGFGMVNTAFYEYLGLVHYWIRGHFTLADFWAARP